jgi:hypothetical protein
MTEIEQDAITKDKEIEAISTEACGAAREIIRVVQDEIIKIRSNRLRIDTEDRYEKENTAIDGRNLNQLALALKNAQDVAHKAIEARQQKGQQRELEFIVRYAS